MPAKPMGAIKLAWYVNGEKLVLLASGWGALSLDVK